MATIKAIGFDLWGVLFAIDRREQYEFWAKELGVEVQHLIEAVDKYTPAVDKGDITPEEFSGKIAEDTGSKAGGLIVKDIAQHQFMRDFGLRAELLNLVDRLRKNGYRTGMLTNISSEPLHFKEVFGHFDAVVKSYEAHAIKPEPAAYHALLDKLGTEAEETVFIDDIAANVEGANAVGIHGVLYENSHQLMMDLKNLGVQID